MNEKQRLSIEAAIAERYPVRLERTVAAGRTSTRIVRPVALEMQVSAAEPAGVLVARTADRREIRISLHEVDDVSLVTTGLRTEHEWCGRWRVGDAVIDPEFGLGVVQAFRGDGEETGILVRFAERGPQRLPLERPGLRPLP